MALEKDEDIESEDDDDDKDEDEQKSDADMDEDETIQTNTLEEDTFRLPTSEESEKEGEAFKCFSFIPVKSVHTACKCLIFF